MGLETIFFVGQGLVFWVGVFLVGGWVLFFLVGVFLVGWWVLFFLA